MIRPLPCSRMCGSTARVIRIEPKTIGVEQRASLLDRALLGRAGDADARVVDQDVDAAGSVEHLAHRTGHRLIVGDVERQEHHSVPLLPGSRLAARPVHGEPGADQRTRGRLTDPDDAPVTSATRPVSTAMTAPLSICITIIIHSTDRNTMAGREGRTDRSSSSERGSRCATQGPQAGHETTHPRSGRAALQARRHRRRRRGGRDVRRRPDQRRLLRPLHLQGGSRRERPRRPAARPTPELRRRALGSGGTRSVHPLLPVPEHRDQCADGCPSAALLDEIARRPAATRQVFTDELIATATTSRRASTRQTPRRLEPTRSRSSD
jgi:hypothetical protein